MKKQIIIAFTLLLSTFLFAQKKELKAVEKALKNNNYSEAKSLLSQIMIKRRHFMPMALDLAKILMAHWKV